MKNKEFDHIIRSKLRGIAPQYDPGSWTLFEEKFEGGTAATSESVDSDPTVFDGLVAERLKNYRVRYNASSWNLLAERLDRIFFIEKNYYRLKLLEVAFIVLLLFTLHQLTPTLFEGGRNSESPQENSAVERRGSVEKPIAEVSDQVERSRFNADKIVENLTEGETPDVQHAMDLEEQRPIPPIAEISTKVVRDVPPRALIPNAELDREKSAIASTKNTQERVEDRQALSVPLLPNLRSALEQPFQIIESSNNSLNQIPLESSLEQHFQSFASLPSLKHGLLPGHTALEFNAEIKPGKTRKALRVGMFGSVDFNQIITPPDWRELRTRQLHRYALGYSSGISIGFEKGRWEIETGVIYTAKYYNPPSVLFVVGGNLKDGYNAEGLKFFELDMFNIPLNFRYNFVYRDRWRVYALGGGSLQIAFGTNYYTATQDGFHTPNFTPAPAPQPDFFGRPGAGEGFLEEKKNIEKGWLEGGSFGSNSYLTTNLGFGVERYFSPRFSIFLQPTYHYSWNYLRGLLSNQIGPNKDRINTMSLFTGVKVRINE